MFTKALLINLLLTGYFLLIVPAAVITLAARFFPSDQEEKASRQRLFVLLGSCALSVGLLVLLIWFNPYGREINSSLLALGLQPVVVALLAFSLRKTRDFARLWPSDKPVLIILGVSLTVLLALLWLAEHSTFYITIVFTALLVLTWWIAARWNLIMLVALSLVALVFLILGGGAVYTATLDQPAWLRSGVLWISRYMIWFSIILAASLVYASLRQGAILERRHRIWRLGLIVVLLASIVYQVYWEGVWAAVHARAFEDHLPFVHFLLSLLAGVLLFFTLRGWRRAAGPGFTLLVTVVATLALVWGWNVSAVELTNRRAEQVDRAVKHYYQDQGRYPSSLAELAPRYILFLQPPVVVRQGGWCYQAGQDYYRLGYISGKFTYSSADFFVEIFAQSGQAQADGWRCDELADKFQANELEY